MEWRSGVVWFVRCLLGNIIVFFANALWGTLMLVLMMLLMFMFVLLLLLILMMPLFLHVFVFLDYHAIFGMLCHRNSALPAPCFCVKGRWEQHFQHSGIIKSAPSCFATGAGGTCASLWPLAFGDISVWKYLGQWNCYCTLASNNPLWWLNKKMTLWESIETWRGTYPISMTQGYLAGKMHFYL